MKNIIRTSKNRMPILKGFRKKMDGIKEIRGKW
jgi:hypothetical protein